eukprot:1143603-Pelagomonas_calceolata.AAC.4
MRVAGAMHSHWLQVGLKPLAFKEDDHSGDRPPKPFGMLPPWLAGRTTHKQTSLPRPRKTQCLFPNFFTSLWLCCRTIHKQTSLPRSSKT